VLLLQRLADLGGEPLLLEDRRDVGKQKIVERLPTRVEEQAGTNGDEPLPIVLHRNGRTDVPEFCDALCLLLHDAACNGAGLFKKRAPRWAAPAEAASRNERQQRLYFLPLPHGQGAFLPTFTTGSHTKRG